MSALAVRHLSDAGASRLVVFGRGPQAWVMGRRCVPQRVLFTAEGSCVVAVGSHEPHLRELDADLLRLAGVVVEDASAALHEAVT